MKKIELLAPAKINLFLKILNKRKDAYHNIETVFEKISLCDKIVISQHPIDEIILESNSKKLSSLGSKNIIYKAADLIKKKFKIRKGVYIYLEKNIPIAAGLGGGSSDAAATLKGLNRLWGLGLHQKELFSLSNSLGSDVALFLSKERFLLGREKGEQVSNIKGIGNLKLWHILVVPDFKISTLYAYSLFDRWFLDKKQKCRSADCYGKLKLTMPNYGAKIIIYALLNRDVSLLNYYSYNSFESIIVKRFPELARLKIKLEALTGDFFHLSGSGPSLFITYSNRKEAGDLAKKIEKTISKCRCFLVNTH